MSFLVISHYIGVIRMRGGSETALDGLGGVGGDEEEGAVIVGMFLGGAGVAVAVHAVDGALAFDDDGAFCGEVQAEFGEELIAGMQTFVSSR